MPEFVRLLHYRGGGKLWPPEPVGGRFRFAARIHYPLPFILIPWQF
jgi:hypothetical protein